MKEAPVDMRWSLDLPAAHENGQAAAEKKKFRRWTMRKDRREKGESKEMKKETK